MSRICLIGGSGFLGRNIAELLVRDQHFLIVPTRRRERAKRNLILLPTIDLVEANVHDDTALDRALSGCTAVINLVGVLHSRPASPYGPDFARAHVELPQRIVRACGRAGVRRLIHVSALGAADDAPSEYQRSKAAGEAVFLAASRTLDVTIFRPSVVFGMDDQFLNLFAAMQRLLPFVVLAGGESKFQPVFVGDVARAIVASVDHEESFGRRYDLAGPTVYTLRELVAYAGLMAKCPRPIISVGPAIGMLQARLMECGIVKFILGRQLLSRDNLRSMQVDNVSSAPFPFGITPTPLESVAPTYLSGVYARSRYSTYRYRGGRSPGFMQR
ncbi:MAG: complex I NDUFA9 subunit family protein [Burkholderiales bacterium]